MTSLEKKLRQLDRLNGELKSKYDGVKLELDEARLQEKTLALDLVRVKSNMDVLQDKKELLKKDKLSLLAENKVRFVKNLQNWSLDSTPNMRILSNLMTSTFDILLSNLCDFDQEK